jgi:MFS family permease
VNPSQEPALPPSPEGYGLAHPTGPVVDPFAEPSPSRRPWRRSVLVAVISAVVVLVLGAPLGLLWHFLAPTVPVLDAGQSGIVVNDPSPEQYIAADGWYTMLGLGFGFVVAVVAWMVLRKDRGPFLLLGVVVGTFGAGYLIGPWVGGLVGRGSYHHWQESAVQGATYSAPPQVHSVGPRSVAAFAAAIVLTLLAGWSNDPDLDEPGARPGQEANAV